MPGKSLNHTFCVAMMIATFASMLPDNSFTANACEEEPSPRIEAQPLSGETPANDVITEKPKFRLAEVKTVARFYRDEKEMFEKPLAEAARSGFLTAEKFDLWWSKIGEDEKKKPEIDFSKHVVVINMHNAGDPNYRAWAGYIDQDADLSVQCNKYTKMGWQRSNQAVVLIMTVPREGVKTINENLKKRFELESKAEADSSEN